MFLKINPFKFNYNLIISDFVHLDTIYISFFCVLSIHTISPFFPFGLFVLICRSSLCFIDIKHLSVKYSRIFSHIVICFYSSMTYSVKKV